MKAILRITLLGTLIATILDLGHLHGADISASGGWSEEIDASDLVAGAGSDLLGEYQSPSDATTIDISNVEFYAVYVRRSDSNWDDNLVLYIKRTGSGSGGGSISGGSAFKEVTGIDSQFFSGYLPRTGITVGYKIAGVSISIPPDTYSTTVIFTVVDQ